MARAFKLPDLGEGIHEGEVLSVRVAVGDKVKEGDIILEVETDKAAVEIPSPYTGVVEEILVKPGDTVKVGQVMLTFSGAEEAAPAKKEKVEKKAPEPPKAVGGETGTGAQGRPCACIPCHTTPCTRTGSGSARGYPHRTRRVGDGR